MDDEEGRWSLDDMNYGEPTWHLLYVWKHVQGVNRPVPPSTAAMLVKALD